MCAAWLQGSSLDGQLQLDQLISVFIKMARQKGFTLAEIRSRVKGWLDFQPPDHFLVIEPDPELRKILLAEISESTKFPVQGVGPEACKDPVVFAGSVPVTLYGRAEDLKGLLPHDVSCIMLQSRSAVELDKLSMDECSRQGVAVISRWPDFLRWARAILLARGMEAGQLNFRDAREKHWQKGLRSSVALTDVVTAAQLPAGCRPLASQSHRGVFSAGIATVRRSVSWKQQAWLFQEQSESAGSSWREARAGQQLVLAISPYDT